MSRLAALIAAAIAVAVPVGAQAQQLPDFQLPPGSSPTPDPRQGPDLPPVPRATPTPAPAPAPRPAATPTQAPAPAETQAAPAPTRTAPQPRAMPRPTARDNAPAATPAPTTPPGLAPPVPTVLPSSVPSAPPTASVPPVASAPAAPDTVPSETEGSGGWSWLWWALGVLAVLATAGYLFLRRKFGTEEAVVVERIQPYRPPPSAAQPAAAAPAPVQPPQPAPRPAAVSDVSGGFVQTRPRQPANGGYVTTSGGGVPAGTVQVQRPPRAAPPSDGGVYARPLRRS